MLFSGILNFVANFFLNPIYSAVSVIFPAFASFFNSITTFIGYGLQYTGFFVKLLMIPTAPLVTFVSLFVGIFAFNITIRAVGLGMAVYHYFKP